MKNEPSGRKIMAILWWGMIGWLAAVGCCTQPPGKVSDHYDGRRFYNPEPDHSFTDMMKWLWEMETVAWPEWVEDEHRPAPPMVVDGGRLQVTYINQATMLIQMDGVNILTDPFWSYRAGPFSWLGSRRVRAPGVDLDALPRIHLVLISHDHYDHLDLPSLTKIAGKHRPVILTGLGVKQLLTSENIDNVVELDWWQDHVLKESGIRITFVPARHQSGRGLFSQNQTLWGGFVIQGPSGKVYFAGDTAYGEFLTDIQERFSGFRLAIFPIGSYEKRWFMQGQHMNPEDAVRAHLLLGVSQSVGMHFSTLLEHPEQTIDAHESDLREALTKYRQAESSFWVLGFGEGRNVPENVGK